MLLTIHKLASRLERIEEYRYADMKSLFPLEAHYDTRHKDEIFHIPPQRGEKLILNKNDFIVGKDKYIWIEQKVTLPKAKEGFDIALYFDLGFTGEGFTDGFEAIIYVDDVAYQGVDGYHREVLFSNEYSEKTIDVKLLLWTGIDPGKKEIMHIYRAEVGYAHRNTTEFFFLADMMIKIYHQLADTDVNKQIILKALDKAVLAIDIYSDNDEFYSALDVSYKNLVDELESVKKDTEVTVHCIGHSHIDVAWLWRLKHTKEKCLRSFSTVMRLMEEFPEYFFTQSQPQLYAYVKEYFPELYAKIKERVAEGRFEPNGGMWVEADCNLISGESMVRQFLYGEKFLKDEFGIKSNCLWLPDVFGYSHAMPQVLKKCDIDTFMTTKISWNEYNKIPHDTFFWRGVDGTEILTHFITTPSSDNPDHYTYFTYNGYIMPAEETMGVWANYKDKEVSKDVAISFGHGDGGGGPTKDMLYARRMLDKIPSVPNVKTNTAREYFNTLHKNVESTDSPIHTWCNELYFENHRGTYTSQAYNKLMNRKLERTLMKTEALSVLANLNGANAKSEDTEAVWKVLLTNQFHDIIPGSSINEVYKDSTIDYAFCSEELEKISGGYIESLVSKEDNTYSVFNPTIFERQDLVFVSTTDKGSFKDSDGNALESQKVDGGYNVLVNLAPLAFKNLTFVKSENQADSNFKVSGKTIETPYYVIEFAEEGFIKSIFDKENKRMVLKEYANRLNVYEDIPIQFDAWNIDYDHFIKHEYVEDLKSFEVAEDGNLSLEIKLSYAYKKSTINQTVKLYANNPRIDFETNADWKENHKLLKTEFDVNIFASKARYDIQFGNVERNAHHSNSWDWAMFEVCAHKWVDFAEHGYGVALLNNCKYGHSVKDTKMCISLIKSATWPDPHADQGEHNFTYSLLPHKGDFREGNVEIAGEFLNSPLVCVPFKASIENKSIFKIDNKEINLDSVKISDDGKAVIIRVHEYMGGRGTYNITSDFEINSYIECNLLEREISKEISGNVISDSYSPYEIKTYKVVLN